MKQNYLRLTRWYLCAQLLSWHELQGGATGAMCAPKPDETPVTRPLPPMCSILQNSDKTMVLPGLPTIEPLRLIKANPWPVSCFEFGLKLKTTLSIFQRVLKFGVSKQEKVKGYPWVETQINSAIEHINVTQDWNTHCKQNCFIFWGQISYGKWCWYIHMEQKARPSGSGTQNSNDWISSMDKNFFGYTECFTIWPKFQLHYRD